MKQKTIIHSGEAARLLEIDRQTLWRWEAEGGLNQFVSDAFEPTD